MSDDLDDSAKSPRILKTFKSEETDLRRPASRARASEPLLRRAAGILAARRRRARHFGASMFGEPAWEMLLHLYLAESHGTRLNVSRISEASGAPDTTALRWLDYLENRRLVRRDPHPTDARASFVVLTERAHELLGAYLSETLVDNR